MITPEIGLARLVALLNMYVHHCGQSYVRVMVATVREKSGKKYFLKIMEKSGNFVTSQ